jgi:hypothetical protein
MGGSISTLYAVWGTLYAVWGTFDTTPQGSSVLLYSGGHTLVVTTDAEIQSRYRWLPAAEYGEATRTALNGIWESAAQMDMWYLLGAMTMTSSGSGNSKVDTMRSVITALREKLKRNSLFFGPKRNREFFLRNSLFF